jgi:hypothetical protein
MEEDLSGMHIKHKDIGEMSDEEKSFYYFKVHDTDNNNNLDGLEMIKAAMHRHGSEEDHVDADELTHITSEWKYYVQIHLVIDVIHMQSLTPPNPNFFIQIFLNFIF